METDPLTFIFAQLLHHQASEQLPRDVQRDGGDGRDDDGHLQVAPRVFEVLLALFAELERLAHHVVDDDADERQLREDQHRPNWSDAAVHVERRHARERPHAADRRELHEEVDEREQVDVRVVDGVFDEDGARVQVDPLVLYEFVDHARRLTLRRAQLGDVATAPVDAS